MYVVILAGGGGTRLWPLSRQDRPKPFLRLIGDETLFQRTVERVRPIVGLDGVYVVAERRHRRHVLEQAPSLAEDHVLGEPMGRNTAPAIALAALAIERPLGETMVVLPADAWISDDEAFRAALGAVAEADGLASGALDVETPLVTLGVRPHRPETGYGYLVPRPGSAVRAGPLTAHVLDAFVEKPDNRRAEELLELPGVAWNAGMFAWRRRAILAALERFAPDVLEGVRLALMAPASDGETGVLEGPEAARRYSTVRSVSIDYAVMEDAARAGTVLMGSLDAGWSDVGSWRAVRELADALADRHPGQSRREAAGTAGAAGTAEAAGTTIDVGSVDVLVRSVGGRLVATVGLSDTIVIDTPDALLVCAADRAQDVKTIVERLREAGETEHL